MAFASPFTHSIAAPSLATMRLSPIYLLPFAMLLARARASSSAGELWVSTLDEPRQCIERSITVSGGAPPYKLSAVQVGQPDAIIVVIQNAIPQPCEVVWLCSIQQKTSFILKLEDSQGAISDIVFSSAVTDTGSFLRASRAQCGSYQRSWQWGCMRSCCWLTTRGV